MSSPNAPRQDSALDYEDMDVVETKFEFTNTPSLLPQDPCEMLEHYLMHNRTAQPTHHESSDLPPCSTVFNRTYSTYAMSVEDYDPAWDHGQRFLKAFFRKPEQRIVDSINDAIPKLNPEAPFTKCLQAISQLSEQGRNALFLEDTQAGFIAMLERTPETMYLPAALHGTDLADLSQALRDFALSTKQVPNW